MSTSADNATVVLIVFFLPFVAIPVLIVLSRLARSLCVCVRERVAARRRVRLLRRRSSQGRDTHNDDDDNDDSDDDDDSDSESSSSTTWLLSKRFALRMRVWMSVSVWWTRWTYLLILLALVSCVELVVEFYVGFENMRVAQLVVEILCCVFFVIEYVLRMFVADDRLRFFFGLWNLSDLLSIMPTVLNFFETNTSPVGYFLRVLRVVRALRVLRAYRFIVARLKSKGVETPRQQMFLIVYMLVTMLFIFSCVMLSVETLFSETPAVESFHVSVYWMVVTMATVGFGDLSPKSVESQMAMTIVIIVAWFVVSVSLAKLIYAINTVNNYDGALRWREEGAQHIVVSGAVSPDSLDHVLRELLRPERGRTETRVLVLLPVAPSADMLAVVRDPRYVVNVQVLVGSLLHKADLRRVRARDAAACLLLTNKYAEDANAVDTALVLQAISVVDFAPHLRYNTFVQVLQNDSKRHLIHAGIPNVLSINELKFGIVSQSCLAPGFSTLVTNLMRGYTPQKRKDTSAAKRPFGAPWLDEYERSCGTQPFSFSLEQFSGETFGVVVVALYLKFGATIFSIESWRDERRRIFLNPDMSRIILADDVAFYVASARISDEQLTADVCASILEKAREAVSVELQALETERARAMDSARSATESSSDGADDSAAHSANDDGSNENESRATVGTTRATAASSNLSQSLSVASDEGALFVARRRVLSFVDGVPPNMRDEISRPAQRSALNSAPSRLYHRRAPAVSRVSRVSTMLFAEEAERDLNRFADSSAVEMQPLVKQPSLPQNALIDLINVDTRRELVHVGVRSNQFLLVILCGDHGDPSFMDSFATLPYDTPIVVVFENAPSETQMRAITAAAAAYTRLEFVDMSPLRFVTSTAIERAHQVIVLNGTHRETIGVATSVDAAVLIVVRAIETYRKDLFMLAEVSEGRSIPFVGTLYGERSDAVLSKQVAVIDSNKSDDYMFFPQYAAGLVFTSSMLDVLLCQVFLNDAALSVVKLMLTRLNGPRIFLTQVPMSYVGRRLGTLFVHLAVRGAIIFGICRRRRNWPTPYVVANPAPTATLRSGDQLYLLANEEPTEQMLTGDFQAFDWTD